MGATADFLSVLAGSAESKAVGTMLLGIIAMTAARLIGGTQWATLAFAAVVLVALSKRFAGGGVNTAKPNMKTKIVVITGAATGIGVHTARELALLGATVIIGVRGGPARLTAAVAEIQRGLPAPLRGNVSAMALDLSSFLSVHSFVQEFLAEHTRLHVLINNAGVMHCPYSLTEDGLEMHMQTNHFGHFLLTNLLLDTLLASRARVVNVSSLAHALTPELTYPKQNRRETYNPHIAYADSKLANIYFTNELQRRYGDKGLQAFSLHPGVVATELSRHETWLTQKIAPAIQFVVAKTAWQGAQTSLYCALSDHAIPGRYHSDAQPWPCTPAAKDSAKAEWLWEESERVCKLR